MVHVTSVQSSAAAAQISGTNSAAGSAAFDAWIPDSSLWVNVARSFPAGAQLVQQTGLSVARSPLMIVMPRSVAAELPAYGSTVGWQFLLPQRVGGPSTGSGCMWSSPTRRRARPAWPRSSSSSNCSAPAARPGRLRRLRPQRPGHLGRRDADLAGQSGPRAAARSPSPRSRPSRSSTGPTRAVPLSGRYPVQGTYELTYPYVLTSASQLERKAAQEFENALKSSYATSYVQYLGFRSGAGSAPSWIGQYGLDTGQPRLTAATAPGQAETSLQVWQKAQPGLPRPGAAGRLGADGHPGLPGPAPPWSRCSSRQPAWA